MLQIADLLVPCLTNFLLLFCNTFAILQAMFLFMALKLFSYIIVFFCFIFPVALLAQTDSSKLAIINENNKAFTLSAADIKAMPHTSLTLKGHDEQMHTYTGISLCVLLQKAGIQLGNAAKKQTASSYLFVKAADGYSVVFALAEVDTFFANKSIILADEQDGKALPDNAKPFQIIATDEKIHARMIRQVKEIDVRKAL